MQVIEWLCLWQLEWDLLSSCCHLLLPVAQVRCQTEPFLSLCVSKQHAVALISGVTAVWPMHKDSDAKHLHSSVQETASHITFIVYIECTSLFSCLCTLWVIAALFHIYIMIVDQWYTHSVDEYSVQEVGRDMHLLIILHLSATINILMTWARVELFGGHKNGN